uniref:PD-(D/E)XK nuclease-like domain-containing protein n=1 Tax=Bionectria ochroleuca TaxID=29856 RepID=A0A8H7N1N3_BIOOC
MPPSPLRSRGTKHGRDEGFGSETETDTVASCSKARSKRLKRGPAKSRSPSRCLSTLELDANGIVFRELGELGDMAGPPGEFLRQIKSATQHRRGILPCSFASEFQGQDASASGWAFVADDGPHLFSSDRDGLGHTPSPECVAFILAGAAEMNSNRHDEASWNSEVHRDVLQAALHPRVSAGDASSASIIPEYHQPAVKGRKVDFAIYIDPTNDPDRAPTNEAITNLRRKLPKGALNHTDYHPLRCRPVAFSIESKRTGENWEVAKLQLGTWLSAQWQFLQRLVELRQKAAVSKRGDGDAGHGVAGHDWYLILSTREKSQTIVWEKASIGSTADALGVYKITYMLQLLRRWAQDTYWPWLRGVMGI